MKLSALLMPLSVIGVAVAGGEGSKKGNKKRGKRYHRDAIVSLGPRPYQLVDSMDPSFLKTKLETCAEEMHQFKVSDFSIGHRGACMQFPEHTTRSYKAAQLMGAGIIECDVTFTKDLQLVCRHSQCDLHTTTDVVLRPEMNAKCSTPWISGPWEEDYAPNCCTSDFTLEEIKTLCAKMDSSRGESAMTAEDYVYGGTATWRTDLYQNECPRVPTHIESIELILEYGGKFIPEFKEPSVEMPFNGYTQEDYAQQMIDEYIAAGVPPENVWPQSFSAEDCYYWIENTEYGDNAIALDGRYDRTPAEVEAWHKELSDNQVNIVAPAMWMLVEPSAPGSELKMTKSHYVQSAHENNLDIVAWTLERTDPGLADGWYWQSLENVTLVDGDKYALLYVLAFEAEVLGIFSDWPATVTFFANCMGVSLR